MLRRSPLVGASARLLLTQTLQGLEGVAEVALTPELFRRAEADRSTASYRPLFELSPPADGQSSAREYGRAPHRDRRSCSTWSAFSSAPDGRSPRGLRGQHAVPVAEQLSHTLTRPRRGQAALLMART